MSEEKSWLPFEVHGISVEAPVPGFSKSYAVYGHSGNAMSPLFYIKRPKWIKDDSCWQQIIKSIHLSIPSGTKIK